MTLIHALELRPGAPDEAWQIVNPSLQTDLEPAHQQRLHAILQSLASWAQVGEPAMMALLPLGDATVPALLLKAGRQGGHGLIITAAILAELDGRAERLLPMLPAAEARISFGQPGVLLPAVLPALPVQAHWGDIGIAWRDMAVNAAQSCDVLPALVTVLAQMRPAEQARRITGWATTAMLPAIGDFDPWVACPLLVLGPGRSRPNGLPHKIVPLRPSGEPPVAATAPPTHAAWCAMRAVAGEAVPQWSSAMAHGSAPTLLRQLANGMPQSRLSLLAALLLHDVHHAAMLLAAWLADDGGAGIDASLIDLMPVSALLDGLEALALPARALLHLSLAQLDRLAQGLAGHPAGHGPVASDLAQWIATLNPTHPALPRMIARRLNGPVGPDLQRLATPPVIRALGPNHAGLALKLTSGGIAQPAGNVQSLATSLAAVRLATAR